MIAEFIGYQSQTLCRTHKIGRHLRDKFPQSSIQKNLLTVSIHDVIFLIEMLHNAVSYNVHSFKVDQAVKVLYIGMVRRLSITLKIP